MKALTLVVAACVAAAAAGVATAQGERAPKLRVVAGAPLVVTGSGFAAREAVTVTALTTLGPKIRRTHASVSGTFRIRFAAASGPCGRAIAVRARGNAGSVAIAKLTAPPCVPPPVY